MVVTYRHIPTDWNTFIPPVLPEDSTARRVMMCGRRARYRLCGIPGISEQPRIINGRPGWCLECLVATYREVRFTKTPSIPELRALYRRVEEETADAYYDALEVFNK